MQLRNKVTFKYLQTYTTYTFKLSTHTVYCSNNPTQARFLSLGLLVGCLISSGLWLAVVLKRDEDFQGKASIRCLYSRIGTNYLRDL